MLQTWIVSPRESPHFATEATPCDLATLLRHVRKMQRRPRGRVRLSLGRGDSDVGVEVVMLEAFLRRLAADGVLVTPLAAIESSGTLRPPGKIWKDEARLAAACADDEGGRSSAPPTTPRDRP